MGSPGTREVEGIRMARLLPTVKILTLTELCPQKDCQLKIGTPLGNGLWHPHATDELLEELLLV